MSYNKAIRAKLRNFSTPYSTDVDLKAERLAEYKESRYTPEMFDHLVGAHCLTDEQTEEVEDYTYKLHKLQNQLIARVLELVETEATEHQKKIIWMYLRDKNLKQMASILRVNRTGIFHSLFGIKRVNKDKSVNHHGGIINKFSSLALEDEECHRILLLIKELKKSYDFSSHFQFTKDE